MLRAVTSRDGGLTWGNPLDSLDAPGAFVRNHPVANGPRQKWMLPLYYTPKVGYDLPASCALSLNRS